MDIYNTYSAQEVYDHLMAVVDMGDAVGIHSALMALCNTVKAQQRVIDELDRKVSMLRDAVPSAGDRQ